MCKPLLHNGSDSSIVQAILWRWSKHSQQSLSTSFSSLCKVTPSLRQCTMRACVHLRVCACVPGLWNLGNEEERSIRAVTIRQPVEHGKLQLLLSVCLNVHIQLNTHINVCTTTHKHIPAISNDDLCPAWKAGMHNCNSHKHTQIHSHMHSQLNTQGCCISPCSHIHLLKKEKMTRWICSNSSGHKGKCNGKKLY